VIQAMSPMGSLEQTIFGLCQEFKCLPSQLEKEDSKTIEQFIIFLNEIREKEIEEAEKARLQSKVR
jgi:hypothetical protein